MSEPKYFRTTQPVLRGETGTVLAHVSNLRPVVMMDMLEWNVTEARALRDWLNATLPEPTP